MATTSIGFVSLLRQTDGVGGTFEEVLGPKEDLSGTAKGIRNREITTEEYEEREAKLQRDAN